MVSKSLKNRDRGFAPFETQLIGMPHVGWVKWISHDRFALVKSPFTEILTPHLYKVPKDVHPSENSFIEVDVDKKILDVKDLKRTSLYPKSYTNYYEVLNIREMNINVLEMPKPYLRTKEDFLARLSINWKNAKQDHLDLALALQILSCPKSIYGVGGIGTQSFSLSGTSKQPLKDLKKTITQSLPLDFKKQHQMYTFNFIENKKNLSAVNRRRIGGKVAEISYNYLYHIPKHGENIIPIQIPTIIQNAEYVSRAKEMDQDVLEFLLTALMIRPKIEDNMMQEIEKGIRHVHNEIQPEFDYTHVPFDNLAIVKLANAFCRLELKETLTDDIFSKTNMEFTELYKEFQDAKEDILKTRPRRETWDVPSAKVSYAEMNLISKDIDIFRIIIRISDEEGKEWVNISDISQHKNYKSTSQQNLFDSLERLVSAGKIIMRKNWMEYKWVKLE